MLWTQANPGLCALAQMAPRSQTALVSGLDYAIAQATGRPPDDLCHRQCPRYLPDHGPSCCRLIKPKPFRPSRAFQNVQTPDPTSVGWMAPGGAVQPFQRFRTTITRELPADQGEKG